jgi:hypothetical protein
LSIAKGSINRVNNLKACEVKNELIKTKGFSSSSYIEISKLLPVPEDWRFYSLAHAQLNSLKESIGKFGVLEPVIARQLPCGDFQLLSGYLRVQACSELGISEIKCEVFLNIADETAREIFLELHRNKVDKTSIANSKFKAVSAIKTDLPEYLL